MGGACPGFSTEQVIQPAVEVGLIFFVEVDGGLIPVQHLPDHSFKILFFHFFQNAVEEEFAQAAAAHLLGDDEVFQVQPLSFPGAVTDIVQRKTFDPAVDGDDKCPPDGLGAKAAFGEMFRGDGYFWGAFS